MASLRVLETVIGDAINQNPGMFIFAAAMAGGLWYFSYTTFAQKADLNAVETKIAARLLVLEIKDDSRDVRMQLRELDVQIFELVDIERANRATRRQLMRLQDLEDRKGRLKDALGYLDRALLPLEKGLENL